MERFLGLQKDVFPTSESLYLGTCTSKEISHPLVSDAHIATKEAAKLRDRQRVYASSYYRRIVDSNGLFLQNECQFCDFVSRDKSENPVHLTHHIIESCCAPLIAKEAFTSQKQAGGFPSRSGILQHEGQTSNERKTAPGFQEMGNVTLQEANDAFRNNSEQVSSGLRPMASSASWPDAVGPAVTCSPGMEPLEHNHCRTTSLKIRKTQLPISRGSTLLHRRTGAREFSIGPLRLGMSSTVEHRIRHSLPQKSLSQELLAISEALPLSGMSIRDHLTAVHLQPSLQPPVASSTSNCFRGIAREESHSHMEAASNTSIASDINPLDSEVHDRIIRFMLAYHIDFRISERPLFQNLFWSSFDQRSTCDTPFLPTTRASSCGPRKYELQDCFTNSSSADIINCIKAASSTAISSTILIICFADTAKDLNYSKKTVSSSETPPTYVASYFCLSSRSSLQYIASRNCGADMCSGLSDIVKEAEVHISRGFDHLLLGRPRTIIGTPASSSLSDTLADYSLDVCREVDTLFQELLGRISLLKKVHRQIGIIASFFRLVGRDATWRGMFGEFAPGHEDFQRYITHISRSQYAVCSFGTMTTASLTCIIVQNAQSSGKHREEQICNFLTSRTEENCGSIPICRAVVDLLLSPSLLVDLNSFLHLMEPLSHLIRKYSVEKVVPTTSHSRYVSPVPTFPLIANTRSAGYVLFDCAQALGELSRGVKRENRNDLSGLEDHVRIRLFQEGPNGYPPIVSDLMCVAAMLNPSIEITSNGISSQEAWGRAWRFIQRTYCSYPRVVLDRVWQQLHNFRTKGTAATQSLACNNVLGKSPDEDPLEWWTKYGAIAPDLRDLALRILHVPTTIFSGVQHITNLNAEYDDLREQTRNSLEEKLRFTSWNLKLRNNRT